MLPQNFEVNSKSFHHICDHTSMAMGDIINLNVGGVRFSTSRETLSWIPDSFFSSMLSGRISTLRDEDNAIFIDRDPHVFKKILNYLRTKDIDLSTTDLRSLQHEAEFYGITPLLRRLDVCESLDEASCGGILFHGTITAPILPYPGSIQERRTSDISSEDPATSTEDVRHVPHMDRHFHMQRFSRRSKRLRHHWTSLTSVESRESPCHSSCLGSSLRTGEARHTASEQDVSRRGLLPCALSFNRVTILRGHFNWIAAAYPHFVCLFRLKDSIGWHLVWTSPYIEETVDRIAVNVKVSSHSQDSCRLVAASSGTHIRLWNVPDRGEAREIGVFDLSSYLEHLFFSGSQLVALSPVGKIGVWHAMTQNWQIQDVVPICSYDTAGSFLLLGCENGSIYYIDMQKFPLRMKDNDLLVTELYKDPAGEMVTALSFYLTPKNSLHGNWLEIAYGTDSGKVRVIVQHPETGGQGPQLFQTFSVHTSPITKVMLSEDNLISTCSDYNHVRSWSVTRFRGMISTQPGSMPLASFKVASLEYMQPMTQHTVGNDIGPYGEKDVQQVFVQKVVPDTDTVFVRFASSGKRVCQIKSADGTDITAFCVHECEGSARMGSRPRRYLFTGHSHGGIQIWDLSTALDRANKGDELIDDGGPTATELMLQMDLCDLTNSCAPTPSISPSPSLINAVFCAPRGFSPSSATQTPERLRRQFLDIGPSSSKCDASLRKISK